MTIPNHTWKMRRVEKSRCLAVFAALMLVSATAAHAAIHLPAIFSNDMVLQHAAKVPVWGWASPGEAVRVSIADQTVGTRADKDGAWMVSLNLENSGVGPFSLTVEGSEKIILNNVMVGEVWLCSGQSNMGFLVNGSTGDKEEIARSENAMLREFHVDKKPSLQPEREVGGRWALAGPKTSGAFSAVGYYYGKTLQRELKVPVGIIHASYGGTPIETWMGAGALAKDETMASTVKKNLDDLASYPDCWSAYVKAYHAWEEKYGRKDAPAADPKTFANAEAGEGDWKEVTLPGALKDPVFAAPGAVWFRKEIELSKLYAGKKWNFYIGVPEQFDTVYWNGEKVAESTFDKIRGRHQPRSIDIPERLVREGRNTIAVRVFNSSGTPGIEGGTNQLRISTIQPLAGKWEAKRETLLPELTAVEAQSLPAAPHAMPAPQSVAGTLFNGTIFPLAPYAIRGVAWYQGETNISRAYEYRWTFPRLIQDWRGLWKQGDFPFYFCQIANFGDKTSTPGDSDAGELREAQTMTLSQPNSGQAVLVDLGEVDIHFKNKKDAGERLALVALAGTYGRHVADSGPVFKAMKIEGEKIRIEFSHADGGLIAKSLSSEYLVNGATGETKPLVKNSPQSQLEGFSICGEDRKWVWADASIEGNTVIVKSDKIAKPVAVRYAWQNNPNVNLYNTAGLPAVPFRTDDFPAVTKDAKYGDGY